MGEEQTNSALVQLMAVRWGWGILKFWRLPNNAGQLAGRETPLPTVRMAAIPVPPLLEEFF